MRKRWASAISIALLLTIIGGLTAGCEWLPSVSTPSVLTPPPSEYPADIIGRVTITRTVLVSDANGVKRETQPDFDFQVWWIVEASITNKEYANPIASTYDESISVPKSVASNSVWVLIYDDKLLAGTAFESSQPVIPKGQSGNLWLSFRTRTDLNPSNVQICYRGQEPFSYGKLIAGDTVAVYDWDSQKVAQTQTPPTQAITVTPTPTEKIVNNWLFQRNSYKWNGGELTVNMKIVNYGQRRNLETIPQSLNSLQFVAVDSTNKWVTARGNPSCYKEYYPEESWTGNLTFDLSEYSGSTTLYLGSFYGGIYLERLVTPLFDVGSPK